MRAISYYIYLHLEHRPSQIVGEFLEHIREERDSSLQLPVENDSRPCPLESDIRKP